MADMRLAKNNSENTITAALSWMIGVFTGDKNPKLSHDEALIAQDIGAADAFSDKFLGTNKVSEQKMINVIHKTLVRKSNEIIKGKDKNFATLITILDKQVKNGENAAIEAQQKLKPFLSLIQKHPKIFAQAVLDADKDVSDERQKNQTILNIKQESYYQNLFIKKIKEHATPNITAAIGTANENERSQTINEIINNLYTPAQFKETIKTALKGDAANEKTDNSWLLNYDPKLATGTAIQNINPNRLAAVTNDDAANKAFQDAKNKFISNTINEIEASVETMISEKFPTKDDATPEEIDNLNKIKTSAKTILTKKTVKLLAPAIKNASEHFALAVAEPILKHTGFIDKSKSFIGNAWNILKQRQAERLANKQGNFFDNLGVFSFLGILFDFIMSMFDKSSPSIIEQAKNKAAIDISKEITADIAKNLDESGIKLAPAKKQEILKQVMNKSLVKSGILTEGSALPAVYDQFIDGLITKYNAAEEAVTSAASATLKNVQGMLSNTITQSTNDNTTSQVIPSSKASKSLEK